MIEPLLCIQGGGAKGAWQAAVLERILADDMISPVAAVGSSAGAINAWLVSAKLRDRSSMPMLAYWRRLADRLQHNLDWVWPVARRLPRGVVDAIRSSFAVATRRRAPVVTTDLFERIISESLPPLEAAVDTYFFATDINESRLPRVFDDQRLATFLVHRGASEAEELSLGISVPVHSAIAASCCLPFVQAFNLAEMSLADGGIYSNLPANLCGAQGTLGGTCVICLLATPISALRPDRDIVDYRSTALLHLLRGLIGRHQQVGSFTFVGPAIGRYKIFLIQPDHELFSGLARGFFSRDAMRDDAVLADVTGARFLEKAQAYLRGESRAMDFYDLERIALPELPQRPPSPGFWVDWVNPDWRR